jgi:type 1 glutamine amidotransferase
VGGRSPIVYIQPGDTAATFALPAYRRLLANAIAWVASAEAKAWAGSNPVPID